MLSLDLFDSKYERELREGAVDDLEYRRMNDLREKMEYLMQAYKKADTDEMRQAIMARYNEYKAEREGYMKVREQQVPSKQDPFAYVKPEPKGIGDIQDPKQKMAQLQQRSKKGPLANVAAGIKAFVKGEPEPMGEQTQPRTHAQNVYFEILKAWEDERDYIVIPFPNAPNPVTMIRGQIWNAIVDLGLIKDPKRRAKYVEERFNDFDSFMSWLGNLKRYTVPAKKKGITPSLPLPIPQQPTGQAQQPTVQAQPTAPGSPLMDPEFTGIKPPGNLQEKKKSNDLDAKDVGLSRELQKARARFPAAASDLEAGILDQMDQQQQAQQELAQQQADLNRQDQQIAGLAQANQQQDGVMRAQGQEIDRLTQRLQQVMAAPAAAPAAAPVTPQVEPTAPAAAPAPDMVYVPDVPADTATQDREIARLDKQIQQLELMMALKTPAERSDLEDRIQALEKARAAQQDKKRAAGAKGAETRKKNQQTKRTKATLKKNIGKTDIKPEKKAEVDLDQIYKNLGIALPAVQTGDQDTPTSATTPDPSATIAGQQTDLKLAAEGKMNKIDVLRQELQRMGPQRFKQVYGMTAAEVMAMDRPAAQQDVPMQAPRFRDAQGRAQLEHSRMAEGQPQELINRYLAIDAETDVDAVRKAIQAISRDSTLSATSKSRLLGQIGMIIQRHRLPIGRSYYTFMQQYMEAVELDRARVPGYPNDPVTVKHRLDTAKAILGDPRSDADSRREAAAIVAKSDKPGVNETVENVRAGMAEIYRRLAPKIERYRDSFLAGQLYDELENYAELHGAEREFKQMMNGARNRAHMEYDTNPGGFHNWFWFLPFEDEQLDEISRRDFLKGVGATAGAAALGVPKGAQAQQMNMEEGRRYAIQQSIEILRSYFTVLAGAQGSRIRDFVTNKIGQLTITYATDTNNYNLKNVIDYALSAGKSAADDIKFIPFLTPADEVSVNITNAFASAYQAAIVQKVREFNQLAQQQKQQQQQQQNLHPIFTRPYDDLNMALSYYYFAKELDQSKVPAMQTELSNYIKATNEKDLVNSGYRQIESILENIKNSDPDRYKQMANGFLSNGPTYINNLRKITSKKQPEFKEESINEAATDDIKKRMSKLEALALAANRAGDDAKCKRYQEKIQLLKQKLSQSMAEGWSDQGNPTAYSVYIDGREWRAYKSDEHARAVADKVRANLKRQGRDQTVTIAPSQRKQVEETHDSKLELAAKEFIKGIYDPTGPVYRSAYRSFQKGQDAEAQLRKHIAQKYGVSEKDLSDAETTHRASKLAGPRRKKDVEEDFGMPGTTIPRKSIIQGYTVYWNPDTQMVSVTRGGDSEQAAIEQARVKNINKDRFLAAAYRMIDRIEELAEHITREPRTARERDDMIDKIRRMMTQDRNPANRQIMQADIETLQTKYRDLKEDSDSREAVEMAIMRRMLVAHTDLIMRHGLDVVVAAIEEVAEDVGEVDEIGTSDVSAYVRRVERILEPDNEV